jgi:hypothetical protein
MFVLFYGAVPLVEVILRRMRRSNRFQMPSASDTIYVFRVLVY